MDRNGQYLLANLEHNDTISSRELMETSKTLDENFKTIEDEDDGALELAWDDASGATLDPNEVRRARAEEIQYVREMDLYKDVPKAQCYARIGKQPISTRRIDINKGDESNPNYRSRLVAREINTHRRDDLFAAAPLLEAFKFILSIAVTSNK